jgi:hypothetical protein
LLWLVFLLLVVARRHSSECNRYPYCYNARRWSSIPPMTPTLLVLVLALVLMLVPLFEKIRHGIWEGSPVRLAGNL